MANWDDVERVGLTLPEPSLGVAHEGSPAILGRAKQFARLRLNDSQGQILQFWVPDPELVNAYCTEDPDTYWARRAIPGTS